jgi:uncharacterized protein (TIGR03382 family)
MLRTRLILAVILLGAGCAQEMDVGDEELAVERDGVRQGVDYSWARPSPQSLHDQGYTFAVRYLSYDDSGKNLTRDEANALIAAGVEIVSNWENSAGDALDGFDAGAQYARDAEAQAAANGMPPTRPIYFSVDFDASPGQQAALNDYFDGVASVIGRERTGAYGGYYVIQRLFDAGKITYGWQTYAWSGGQWEPRAQLRQVENGIAGGTLDRDEAVAADFGQWGLSKPPRGTLDAAACEAVTGWAQDEDHPDQPIDVHVYFDGGPGDDGAIAVATAADIERPDLCDAIGSCAHGFSLAVPAGLRDGKRHEVTVYGIDAEGVENPALAGGGQTVRCDVPTPAASPTEAARRHITSAEVLSAWGLHAYDVAVLPDDTVDAYGDGADLSAAPRLVQADGDPAVYLVDGTLLRHVISPESMAAWHFTAEQIEPVADLDAFTVGADLPAAPFVMRGTGPAVYVLDVLDPSDPDAVFPDGDDLDGGCAAGGGAGGPGALLAVFALVAVRRRRRC